MKIGILKEVDKIMVTIYDIAKKANVSPMTVSRVINNTGRVSEKTRNKVRKIMEEMNYVPNSVARSLVLQESRILSLLIADITNPFYTTLARGAEDAARQSGYRLLLGNSDEDLDKEKDYVDTILSTRVDGVLFAPAGDRSLAHLQKLRQHRIPFVLIDREVPGMECDMVVGDSREGASRLVEHLIGLGHRHIALINGSSDISTARLRQSGYEDALERHGIARSADIMFEAGYTKFHAGEIVDRILARRPRPTAIFAANNIVALEAIRALKQRGLEVPEQMSVVCFDDLEAEYVVDPFLTVASQPAYDFGLAGIRMLVDRIRDRNREYRKTVLPSRLFIRRSTAPVHP